MVASKECEACQAQAAVIISLGTTSMTLCCPPTGVASLMTSSVFGGGFPPHLLLALALAMVVFHLSLEVHFLASQALLPHLLPTPLLDYTL